MANNLVDLQYLVDALHALPGIGNKAAKKIAHFLLRQNEQFLDTLIKRIKQAKQNISLCKRCNNLTDQDNQLCYVCNDIKNRDKSQLCLITNVEDLELIEESNTYHGLYYVLWKELSIKSAKEEINLEKLFNYLKNYPIEEVIFATNLTANGFLTSSYLYEAIKKEHPTLVFSRIALGLPLNSVLDYADTKTIGFALKNRIKFEEDK